MVAPIYGIGIQGHFNYIGPSVHVVKVYIFMKYTTNDDNTFYFKMNIFPNFTLLLYFKTFHILFLCFTGQT